MTATCATRSPRARPRCSSTKRSPRPRSVLANRRSSSHRRASRSRRSWQSGNRRVPGGPRSDPSAVVDPSATIGARAVIGPLVAIGAGAEIGDDCVLHPGVVVGAGARLGRRCTLHPRAMLLDRCSAGDASSCRPVRSSAATASATSSSTARFTKIPQTGHRRTRRRRRDRGEHLHRPRADRRDADRYGNEDRQPRPDRAQLPHRAARRDRRSNWARRLDRSIGDYVLVGGQAAFKGHLTVGSRVRIAGGHARLGRRSRWRVRQRVEPAQTAPRRIAATGVAYGAFRNSTTASRRWKRARERAVPASDRTAASSNAARGARFRGPGLHTGRARARARLWPTAAGSGIALSPRRRSSFPRIADYVVDTRRATGPRQRRAVASRRSSTCSRRWLEWGSTTR